MSDLDLLGVCVTFLNELSTLNNKTVSIVSAVDLHDSAIRTYRLERRTTDGIAFALATHESTLDILVRLCAILCEYPTRHAVPHLSLRLLVAGCVARG